MLFETSLPPLSALAAVTITITEIKINNYSKPSTFPRVMFLENTMNSDFSNTVLSKVTAVPLHAKQAEAKQYPQSTPALEEGGWLAPCPSHFMPGKETQRPLYSRLGGPWGRSRWIHKISPPPEFEPQTVQPVISHYTNC